MDKNLLVSASTAQKAVDKPRTPDQPVDGDSFASILDDKVNGSSKDTKKEQELFAGKEPSKGHTNSKESNEKLEQFRKNMGLKLETLVGNKNYIYNLSLKDPGTLSMAERQSFRLGEFSPAHLAVKDFQSALSQKGLHLKDLSFTQMSQLSRCKSKEELAQRIDGLNIQHAAAGDGSQAIRLERNTRFPNSPLSAAYTELKTSPPGLLDASRASMARKSEEAADTRKKQREEVIRQVMVHIDVQRVANQTEVALKLNPEYLGDMKIKLRFEGHSSVSADFETTNQETKDLLDEDMGSLHQAFSDKGMTLTHGRTHLVETVS